MVRIFPVAARPSPDLPAVPLIVAPTAPCSTFFHLSASTANPAVRDQRPDSGGSPHGTRIIPRSGRPSLWLTMSCANGRFEKGQRGQPPVEAMAPWLLQSDCPVKLAAGER